MNVHNATRTRSRFVLLGAALGVLLLLPLALGAQGAQAQEREPWSPLVRLSSLQGEASEAAMVADPFGELHVFWVETGFEHQRSLIMYSSFNGSEWTKPMSIYASWPAVRISFVSPAVDLDGILHLAWSEGNTGPVHYMNAPIEDAYSSKNWSAPITVDLDALKVRLNVDEEGGLHLVYVTTFGEDAGVYYSRSDNGGKAWTYPRWLDPDIPSNGVPSWFDVHQDDQGGLHIVWSYSDQAQGFISRWVRYAHSLDGGETWSEPFSIDFAGEIIDELRMPNPGIVTNGSEVHVVWAVTSDTNREHRFSTDRGKTWSETEQLFGNLAGQAIGDGLAVDSLGRVHFAGQLRFPMAVHHAYWEDSEWSDAEIAYFIKQNSEDEVEDRIGAHNVRLAVREGNQLVMTFTTAPVDPQAVLYAMHRPLEDAPELEPYATPTPTPFPTLTPVPPAVTPTPSPTPANVGGLPESDEQGSLALPVWMGLIPATAFALLVIAGAAILRR